MTVRQQAHAPAPATATTATPSTSKKMIQDGSALQAPSSAPSQSSRTFTKSSLPISDAYLTFCRSPSYRLCIAGTPYPSCSWRTHRVYWSFAAQQNPRPPKSPRARHRRWAAPRQGGRSLRPVRRREDRLWVN